jgi:hypothetical protein
MLIKRSSRRKNLLCIYSTQTIQRQIREQLPTAQAELVRQTPHGPRYKAMCVIIGPAQRLLYLDIYRQDDVGSAVPRMITAIGRLKE